MKIKLVIAVKRTRSFLFFTLISAASKPHLAGLIPSVAGCMATKKFYTLLSLQAIPEVIN
jgi:hypothetical protein